MTDPISDMLIRIKNAYLSQKKEIEVPYSRQKLALAQIFKNQGKIANFSVTKEKNNTIKIKLKKIKDEIPFVKTKVVSLPGRRIYIKSGKIANFARTGGLIIISTSKGLKTAEEAIKEKLGGEIICQIN